MTTTKDSEDRTMAADSESLIWVGHCSTMPWEARLEPAKQSGRRSVRTPVTRRMATESCRGRRSCDKSAANMWRASLSVSDKWLERSPLQRLAKRPPAAVGLDDFHHDCSDWDSSSSIFHRGWCESPWFAGERRCVFEFRYAHSMLSNDNVFQTDTFDPYLPQTNFLENESKWNYRNFVPTFISRFRRPLWIRSQLSYYASSIIIPMWNYQTNFQIGLTYWLICYHRHASKWTFDDTDSTVKQ